MKKPLLIFSVLFAGLLQASFGDITTSTTEPATDILSSLPSGGITTRLIDEDFNSNHARGQLFSLGDGTGSAFQISAVTVKKDNNQTYTNSTITLRIFEGTQAQWTSGTGHSTADDGSNYLVDTTVDLLYTEAFALNTTFSSNDYVTFTLATPITVNENSDFGFFMVYDQGAGDDDDFEHLEGGTGGRLSITTSGHGVTTNRNMVYFVHGTPVDGTPVTTSATEPTTDIISSSPAGTTGTSLFAEGALVPPDNHARGQLFSLPDGSGAEYEVTAVTIKKSNDQTFANDTITLRIFEGTQAQWDAGSGHSTIDDGDDYYVDTTVTPLRTQVFLLDGTITNNHYVTFPLGSPLTVNEDSDFGFFMTYEQSDGANPDTFQHRENTSGGGRISIVPDNHDTSGSRKLVYYLHGQATGTEPSSIELASPFQDRMVLQRDKPVKVWGTSLPDASLSVSINGFNASGTADSAGNWEIELPALTAGGPYSLDVTSGAETVTVNDVLVGDVWVCFGQSNMVYTLNQMDTSWRTTYINEIASNDEIRCLKIDQDASLTEEESHGSSWLSNSASSSWTAVGSVFASQLHDATNVPVGIIWAAWGSSSIEGWLPLSIADEQPHFADMMQLYQSIGEYRSGDPVANRAENAGFSSNIAAITEYTTNGWPGGNPDIFMRTRPNIIYNKMIHPMRKYGISGFIWYQGEANAGDIINVATYRHTSPRMIEEYRKRFDQGDLPFLGVQLPSNSAANAAGELSNWHWFREAQGDGLDAVNNAHYPVTVDTGIVIANGNYNVHPTDKEPIGVRLALLARKYALGESIEAHGPQYDSMSVSGNQVTMTFTNATGLKTTGGSLNAVSFQLAGADQIFHPATSATISGNTVVVSSSSESNPVAVRYAWIPNARDNINLVNGDNLPAAPFRTDDWALPGLAAADPIANDDAYSTLRDQPLSIPADGVLSNDFDINLDPLESNLVTPTTNGVVILLADGSFTYTPEEGFAGSDSFTYEITEAAGPLTSSTVTVSLTVEGVPSAYYTWRGGISWNPGDDETTGGDPDGDGVANFLEFALGMNPLLADTENLPQLTPTPTGADYDFNNDQPGIIYEVLLSTDLVTWTEPAFATLTSESTTPVSIPMTEEDNGRLFVRLRVSQ